MMFACVKVGDKYNDDYVRNLQRGVSQHLRTHKDHVFVCYTDKPIEGVICEELPADLPGWWAKIGLFKLREPMIYFDLDVVITGNLDRLLEWPGFGIIEDWHLPGFNSSVMKLTGHEYGVWEKFSPQVMSRLRGDQDFITEALPHAAMFPTDWFPSFKGSRCYASPPGGAIAVIMHGKPKPHELLHLDWVNKHWAGEAA